MSVKDETTRQARMNARAKATGACTLAAVFLALLVIFSAAAVVGSAIKNANQILFNVALVFVFAVAFIITTRIAARTILDYLTPLPPDHQLPKEGETM